MNLVLAVIILRKCPSDALFHRLNLSSEHVKYLQQQSVETLKETDEFCEILEG